MKYRCLLLLSFLPYTVQAQLYEKQEQVTIFSSRLKSPISVEVVQTKNELTFYGENKSYYPYRFEIEFKIFSNLSPTLTIEKTVLHPGRNRLFKLTIQNPNQSPSYSYVTRYVMGDYNDKPDEKFPFLMPLAEGRKLEHYVVTTGQNRFYYPNTFKANLNDTIYAIRKGIVTALPNQKEVDRILNETLEVRHRDGTVAVYSGVKSTTLLVDCGQKIYPGQPIGVVSDIGFLRVNVYAFSSLGHVFPIELNFVVDDSLKTYQDFSSIIVQHPIPIVEMELNDRELKKFRRGMLYTKKLKK